MTIYKTSTHWKLITRKNNGLWLVSTKKKTCIKVNAQLLKIINLCNIGKTKEEILKEFILTFPKVDKTILEKDINNALINLKDRKVLDVYYDKNQKPRILLINSIEDQANVSFPHTGLIYLSKILNQNGYDCKIFDFGICKEQEL